MAELVVYGRDSCSVCNRFKGSCDHGGLKYRFADVDVAGHKSEMLRKLRGAEWWTSGSKFRLPLVDVYGQLLERPSFGVVKAARDRLPREEKVDSMKQKFKDLDLNQDGTLSFDEMRQLMTALAPSLSEVQLQRLFCAADVNQNGVLELEEFIDFVMYGKVAAAKISAEAAEAAEAVETVEAVDVAEAAEADAGVEAETRYGTWEEWKAKTLEEHNFARRQHGVLPLAWSDECFRLAKQQARVCQAAGKMLRGNCHGPSGPHGQNLYWNPCTCPSPPVMVRCWTNEAVQPGYDFKTAVRSPGTEQFTQVVWKDTTHVAMALSDDEKFCIANYYPAGNVGDFQDHVFPEGTQPPKPFAGALAAVKGAGGKEEASFETNREGVETLRVRRYPHPTIDEILEPFPGTDFKERIKKAFQQGADLVTIDRVRQPPVSHVRVIATKGSAVVAQLVRLGVGFYSARRTC
ncbi:unnamed protein product [Effrenium voratum]|uniref:EF-hand domain-containing protein n=1 Tax=Effrenium voratum TaxID=2562239 RepID=A0AA36ICX7_9DINO|nr:unnamed protein product [Effrenium voratum]CAJ1424263.1 unnamed protein product [Effrenium voratum]